MLAGLATAQAETQTLHYPTEGNSIFTIKAPSDSNAADFEALGGTGSLESKNGSCLQFRAVECDDEKTATAEISSIAVSGTKMIEDSYSEFKEEDAPEFEMQGDATFKLRGKGETEEGKDAKLLFFPPRWP